MNKTEFFLFSTTFPVRYLMEVFSRKEKLSFSLSAKSASKLYFMDMGCVCEKRQVTHATNVVHKPLFYRGGDYCFSNFEKTLIRTNWNGLKNNISKIGVLTFIR